MNQHRANVNLERRLTQLKILLIVIVIWFSYQLSLLIHVVVKPQLFLQQPKCREVVDSTEVSKFPIAHSADVLKPFEGRPGEQIMFSVFIPGPIGFKFPFHVLLQYHRR